ncbi:MAG: acyltransferase [Chloroflexi bacterium]|nr:acyltransferase [Chloroflexota bacterium]
MHLFFFISGYLIHYSFLRKPTQFNTPHLYWHRFWRIYPPYLLALLYMIFSRYKLGPIPAADWPMILNHFAMENISLNASWWSLRIELECYLVYPLVLLLRRWMNLKPIMLGATLMSIGILLLFVNINNVPWQTPIYGRAMLWAEWMFGAYLAEFGVTQRLGKVAWVGFGLTLTVLVLNAIGWLPFPSAQAYTLTIVLMAFLFAGMLAYKPADGWLNRRLSGLGLISYSFYLWHQPQIFKAISYLHTAGMPQNGVLDIFVGGIVTFIVIYALSWVLYKFIELPSVKIGERLWHRLTAPQQAASA